MMAIGGTTLRRFTILGLMGLVLAIAIAIAIAALRNADDYFGMVIARTYQARQQRALETDSVSASGFTAI